MFTFADENEEKAGAGANVADGVAGVVNGGAAAEGAVNSPVVESSVGGSADAVVGQGELVEAAGSGGSDGGGADEAEKGVPVEAVGGEGNEVGGAASTEIAQFEEEADKNLVFHPDGKWVESGEWQLPPAAYRLKGVDTNKPWWTWPYFPALINKGDSGCGPKKYAINPALVKEAFDRYASSVKSMVIICKELGIDYVRLFELMSRYPVVHGHYLMSQRIKAHQYGSKASDIWDDKNIPAYCWERDKSGALKLSMSGVRYLEGRSSHYMRQAEVHETGTYVQKTQIESKNLNVNLNTRLNTEGLSALLSKDLSELSELVN